MGFNWFTSTFLNFSKFSQIKEREPNFFGGTNSAERVNYLVPLFVFQFQKFQGLMIFVIDYIAMGFTWFTSTFLYFFEIFSN